jgi:hypothetical protein
VENVIQCWTRFTHLLNEKINGRRMLLMKFDERKDSKIEIGKDNNQGNP